MSRRQHLYGTHHSHAQPRSAAGTFLRYEMAGRSLGREAVAAHARIILVTGRLCVAPATRARIPMPAAGTVLRATRTGTGTVPRPRKAA